MEFIHLTEVGSTNDEIRRLAQSGQRGPLWVRADSQSGGRGRNGRVWTSEAGNLYTSGLYPIGDNPLEAAQLGFAAALAILDTVKTYAPEAAVTLKWPNDVLVEGAKISGILIERAEGPNGAFVIIGVGINLISHPETALYRATHLLDHIAKEQLSTAEPVYTGAAPVLAVLASRFNIWRAKLLEDGFAPIGKAWTENAQGLGQIAKITLPNRSIEATLLGIGTNGELQIKHANGTIESLYAGDVFPQTIE